MLMKLSNHIEHPVHTATCFKSMTAAVEDEPADMAATVTFECCCFPSMAAMGRSRSRLEGKKLFNYLLVTHVLAFAANCN